MNRFHRLLAALGIAAIALTACSGGGGGISPHTSPIQGPANGQGLHNVAVPPASSRTTYGTAHLALTLPHVFTGRNAQAVRATKGLKPAATQRVHAAAGRSPTYVNPTCGECDNVIDLFVDGSLLTNLDGCAGSGDSVCVNTSSADGTQSINVPLFSSGTNDVVAVEWGPNGLLAIGETWIGSFTPGTAVNASLTMLMNAEYIGILDLYNQADAEVLTGQTYDGLGGSCGQSQQQAQFGLYTADASGTFVPIAGYGGTSTPTLTSTPDAGGSSTTPQTTIPGVYQLRWDSNCDGATLHASAANPAYAIYASSTNYDGPVDGNGNSTNGYLACFNNSGPCPGGPYQGLWNIYFKYSNEQYFPQLDINTTPTVSGTADVVDVTPGQMLAYISQGTSGVSIRTESGTQVGSIATSTSSDVIALDDSGNVYDMTYPPRDGQGNATGPGTISLYTPGLGLGYPAPYARSAVTYAPSSPNNLLSIAASGAGELVAFEGAAGGETIDEWDPGQTGSPSRTFSVTNSGGSVIYFYFVGHDGSVYTASSVNCGDSTCIQYNFTPPGATTPTRTVSESIVPQGSQSSFSPNYIAVGGDGTIYVTEWSFSSTDTLAGLYIYPVSGPERYYSAGAEAPNGIDLDASGNIYVVNNNTAYDSGNPSADTADNVAVLSPDGGTVLRRITGSFVEPYALSVTPDGTAFIGDFPISYLGNAGGTFLAAAGSTTASEITSIGGNTVVSWNGSVETTSRARSVQSAGRGGISAHGGGLSPRDAARLRRRIGNRFRR
jgi:hypothetical protein